MKVGTDGALLGAWASVDRLQGDILDVGTGTGLIALMLAQRCDARIDAIDIDADACRQARSNVAKSPFAGRITVEHLPFTAFAGRGPYGLIVSNPPYFSRSLKCPDAQRSLARHTDTLPLSQLLRDTKRLLAPSGRLALVLPFDQRDPLHILMEETGYRTARETVVYSVAGGKPKRLLTELTLLPAPSPELSELAIETQEQDYTEPFKALMRDFYLKI